MAIFRGPGGTGDSAATPGSDASIASTAAAAAAASATAAASSASSAGTDAGTAQNAATNAANSQTAAATSAGNAATSASAASASASSATASATAAALSESNTATLYDNFDDRYLGVKATSPAVDNDGNTLQEGALYFNSTTKAMYVWNATLWVPLANEVSSTAAATSATAALASQNAAATSASNAATSATNASNSASTASTQASNAATSASSASTSASNASSSASSASSSASTATTQASNASTSATNAASSASAASGSASTATTQAGLATTQASNAATSASNAAASYDSFDDRYLGAKASDPSTDNDGNALLTGAIYWNTTVNSLYVWDGSTWLPAAFSSAGAVTSFNTRTGAITLSSGDVTTALGFTPGQGTVTSVSGTSPVSVATGTTTPVISMPAATTSVNGYLTSTDWTTFNNKGSGTVTSVTATSPVTSTGGATPVIAMPAATTSVSGYLTSTDWTTFNGKSNTNGTVTSVAALTLGTTGTDLSSTVANGTTTPVITLNVPTASALNRGVLSSADWSTFDSKGSGTVTSASVVSANGFTGTVATATTTPAITLTTSITGVLKGNGTAISAATAGTDYVAIGTASTFTASQRGAVTTDNDLSFDLSVGNNFSCTPTGTGALTFTNHTAGQSGYVLLINTGGHAITAAATTKVGTTFLTTVSTAGTYLISYFDNGTNAHCTASGALA